MNGEEFSASGTIACSYDGVSFNILHTISETKYIKYSFQFSAAYLMGDKEAPSYRHFDDLVFLSDISDDFNTSNVVLSESELLEEYGIEIVSVTELIPIENSFE